VFIRCRIAMDSSGVELSGVLSEIGTAVADETVLVTGYTCNDGRNACVVPVCPANNTLCHRLQSGIIGTEGV
jgi:hypothetical protein